MEWTIWRSNPRRHPRRFSFSRRGGSRPSTAVVLARCLARRVRANRVPLPLRTTDENQRWRAECLTEFATDLGARYVAEALLDGWCAFGGGGVTRIWAWWGVRRGLSTSAGGVRLCGGREPMTCRSAGVWGSWACRATCPLRALIMRAPVSRSRPLSWSWAWLLASRRPSACRRPRPARRAASRLRASSRGWRTLRSACL